MTTATRAYATGHGRKRSIEERNEIIEEYLPLVRFVATRLSTRLPSQVELDDLIDAGVLGLIDAMHIARFLSALGQLIRDVSPMP